MWGSTKARFKNWQIDDHLVFIVDKSIAGYAIVDGKPFISDLIVWNKALYPHRIKLKFVHLLPRNRLPFKDKICDILTTEWGYAYGWGLTLQQVIEGTKAEIIINTIRSYQNELQTYNDNLANYLEKARLERQKSID